MYSNNYISPNNNSIINDSYQYNYPMYNDDRFFLAPFLLGGLTGGAIGYGLANGNGNNGGGCCQGGMIPIYPVNYINQYPYPYSYSTNSTTNYYY